MKSWLSRCRLRRNRGQQKRDVDERNYLATTGGRAQERHRDKQTEQRQKQEKTALLENLRQAWVTRYVPHDESFLLFGELNMNQCGLLDGTSILTRM